MSGGAKKGLPPVDQPLADRTVVLAHHDAFVAGYVEQALRAAGAMVVGPLVSGTELATTLASAASASFSACIGSFVATAEAASALAQLPAQRVALLIIGEAPPAEVDLPWAALRYPFASYQVVDALANLLSAGKPDDAQVPESEDRPARD